MTNIEKLRLAQKLIVEVRDNLDKGTEKCDHCGHVRSVDQEARSQWEMLEAAQQRVGKVSNWMENAIGK